ncbi:MAG: hypothetical protein KatS3mg011_1887 [Acidimicrobiia bacterium]|nr:MAG: hypothetical protein KatS3mg011_1887 [Acidimicrobiia bacterium]
MEDVTVDSGFGVVLAAATVVVFAEVGGIGRRLPFRVQKTVRFLSLGLGLSLVAVGLFALAAEAASGPTGEPSRLAWAVPVVVTVAGGLVVWGSERWQGREAAWLRRAGWALSIAGVSLTALSDVYLVVALLLVPALLAFPPAGEHGSADRVGVV